jgi:hypothetical protein
MPERILSASDLPVPNVISDTMSPVQSMVDGKMYDSKTALRATYLPGGNAEGKRYVEIGNDPARHKPKPKHKVDRKAVRESLHKAEARFSRGERINSK